MNKKGEINDTVDHTIHDGCILCFYNQCSCEDEMNDDDLIFQRMELNDNDIDWINDVFNEIDFNNYRLQTECYKAVVNCKYKNNNNKIVKLIFQTYNSIYDDDDMSDLCHIYITYLNDDDLTCNEYMLVVDIQTEIENKLLINNIYSCLKQDEAFSNIENIELNDEYYFNLNQ